MAVLAAPEAAGWEPGISSDLSMVPTSTLEVKDESEANKVLRLIEALDDHDDVQNVYSDFDIPGRGDGRLRRVQVGRSRLGRASRAPVGGYPLTLRGRHGSIERMFVLGIDPGLSRCGYGVVTRRDGVAGRGGRRGASRRSRPCPCPNACARWPRSCGPWWPSSNPSPWSWNGFSSR